MVSHGERPVDGASSFAAAARRSASVALIGLFTVLPVSAGEKTLAPRDSEMRRIVAEFEAAAARVPRQFRADLTRARASCGKRCEEEAFARTVANSASVAERRLTAALRAAETELKKRVGAVKGPDSVLGAAGDLSRAVADLELASQRVAAEMTESLSVLKGAGFGGQPLLTTLQLRLASLVIITPISLATIFTVHVAGSPTAWVHVDGYARHDSTVTVDITCGSAKNTEQTTTDADGRWGMSTSITLSGSNTCTLTATGTGIGTGSTTTDLHFQ